MSQGKICKRRLLLCREGVYYLLVLAFVITGALLRDINLLMVVTGMMIGPLVYNCRAVFVALRNVSVRRQLPTAVCAGDLLIVTVSMTNRHPRRGLWSIAVEDTVRRIHSRRSSSRTKASVLFSHIPPGETRTLTYSGRLNERGRYCCEGLKTSTRFPLGLVRRTLHWDHRDIITVYPRLGRLTSGWQTISEDATLGSRRRRRQQGPSQGDFYGLRDWRFGDSRRWIHWRTSARRGSLTVRQFERQQNEDLLLLVDLWQPAKPGPLDRDHVELAVSFAATVAADHCRQGGSQLTLAVTAEDPHVVGGVASTALQNEIMERLALARAGSHDSLPELLVRGFAEMPSAAGLVLVSTRPVDLSDTERFGGLPDEVGRFLAKRRVACVDVSSSELDTYFHTE